MDNSIASFAETFIPPRADPPQQKSNPAFERNQQQVHPSDARRNERAEGPADTTPKTAADDQVNPDNNSNKRDFNEVLAKKMSKKENRAEKKPVISQDSDPQATEGTQVSIPIAEVAIPDTIASNKAAPLINVTKLKQTDQTETQKPQPIDELIKNAVPNNKTIETQAEKAVVPVENAVVSGEKAAKQPDLAVPPVEKITTPAIVISETSKETVPELSAIPIKTIPDKPQFNKTDLQDIQQTKNTPEQPTQKVKPETVLTASKTQQNTENLTVAAEITKLKQPQEIDINAQTAKTDQKPVITLSEGIPKSGLQNKFEKSLELSKQQAASQPNTLSDTETNTAVSKNISLTPVAAANKELSKTLTDKSAGEKIPQTLTSIAPDADIKTDTGNTVKQDFKPLTNSIVNQVTEHIRASMTKGREQMSIALDPPELGRIMIKFQQKNGEIVGLVQADKARTHQEIADEMPQIIRALNESGIAVKKVEVVLTEQNTQDTLSDNSTNDSNNTGRQGFQNSSDNPENQSSDNRTRTFSRQYNSANNPDNYINTVSDDAINIYA